MNKIGVLVRMAANSHMRRSLVGTTSLVRHRTIQPNIRFLSSEEDITESVSEEAPPVAKKMGPYGILMDRRGLNITPEDSIKYMKSEGISHRFRQSLIVLIAFQQTYGPHRVWEMFRRNFRRQWSPFRSRQTCIVEGQLWTTNPCPICRDEYLVLHYTNLDLLKQFIRPQTGVVYENTILCLCSEQYEKLLVAINLAKNYGLITFEMPLRTYDYKDYYKDFNPELYKCSHNH